MTAGLLNNKGFKEV